jgi:putative ABC transport system permease protein
MGMRFPSFVFKNVIRRRVRSGLTVIGMAVSVGAVVSLVGVSRSSVQSFLAIYQQQKIAIVVQQRGAKQRLTSTLSDKLGDEIVKIPGVKQVNPGLVDYMSIEELGINAVVMQGWVPDSPIMKSLNILPGGHWITASDNHTVLLGSELADNLAANKDTEKYARVGSKIPLFDDGMYTVVGIVKSPSPYESGGMWVSLANLQKFMARKGQVTGYTIVVEKPDDAKEVERIRAAVEKLGINIKAMHAEESVTSTTEIRFIQAMSWLVSAIAIVIGAIGILNTMIMSVSERTKEIGILRAIGWRKRRIVRMILVESVLLSLSGGVLGTFAAVGLTRVLGKHHDVAGLIDPTISPDVMFFGVVVALGVGILGAAYPAFRGALLLPTEALRHE